MKNKRWNRDETYEKFLGQGYEPLTAMQKVEDLDRKRRQVLENGGKVLSSGMRDSAYVLAFVKENYELFEGLCFKFNRKTLESGMKKLIETTKEEMSEGNYKELVTLSSCKDTSEVFNRYRFVKKKN